MMATPVKQPNLFETMEIAKRLHGDQKRDAGEPYVKHYEEVFDLAMHYGINQPNMLAALLLHDVLEDTSTSLEDLEKLGFEKETLEYVTGLTKPKSWTRGKYELYQEMFGSSNIKYNTIVDGLLTLFDRLANLCNILDENIWAPARQKAYCYDTFILILVLQQHEYTTQDWLINKEDYQSLIREINYILATLLKRCDDNQKN